ncbi:hypothetical protein [Duganella sp. P38]|uniref:hypothetical protein n=1 Tax=Duganella sp. P38 TaxID=3423949 RepID=UPI003D7B06F6
MGTTSGAALARVGFLTDNVKVFGFVIKNLAMRIRQKLQKAGPAPTANGAHGWKCCNLVDDFLRNKKARFQPRACFSFQGRMRRANEKGYALGQTIRIASCSKLNHTVTALVRRALYTFYAPGARRRARLTPS